jgi:hypothetical protein
LFNPLGGELRGSLDSVAKAGASLIEVVAENGIKVLSQRKAIRQWILLILKMAYHARSLRALRQQPVPY